MKDFDTLDSKKDDNEFYQNLRKQLVEELYEPSQLAVTDVKESDIKLELVSDDATLATVFRDDGKWNRYYRCTNLLGQQALLKVFAKHYVDGSIYKVISSKVLLPFSNRDFTVSGTKVFSHNLDTDKWGLFSLKTEQFCFAENYDSLVEKDGNIYASQNGKQGRLLSPEIPIKYDDIVDLKIPDGHLTVVKKNNLWGAYCLVNGTHERYIVEEDRAVFYHFAKKRVITPVFDKIEFFATVKTSREEDMLLKVFLDGKVGVLSAYQKTFEVPIVFDEIQDLQKQKGVYFGRIGTDNYMIFNGSIARIQPSMELETARFQEIQKVYKVKKPEN